MTPSILLLVGTIGDILTTLFALGIGIPEMNPVVDVFGWPIVLAYKAVATIFVVWCMNRLKHRLGWLAWIPGCLMILLVTWNVTNIVLVFQLLEV